MNNKLKEGETLFADGEVEEAEKCFLSVIDKDSNSKVAYNNLGVVAIEKKDVKSAVDYFTRSLEIDPFYKDAIINYTDLLRMLNQHHIALPLLEKIVEKNPNDKEIVQLLEGMRPISQYRSKIAVLSLPGLESFLENIVNFLKTKYEVQTCYSTNGQEIESAVKWADAIWLEWANELTIKLTNHPTLLEGKHVLCRLHSYEALAGFASKINWKNICDLIFVAEHIKSIVLQQVPNLPDMVKNIYVVPNGINIDKFSFKSRSKGENLAYIGNINFKKGPMLLLHAFRELVQTDDKYRLFIAGDFQDARYQLYFNQMIKEMDLENNVHFDGWVTDVNSWLEDKQYILCTSVLEGHPVGIMEAMARGLKPLIHNFVGARGIYPKKYIWNTIPEFVNMVTGDDYDSMEYRNFIEQNFSFDIQIKKIENIFRQSRQVEQIPMPMGSNIRMKNETPNDTINFSQPLPRQVELVKNRKAFTVHYCRGKKVLHIGCADAGIMELRISQNNYLHHHISQVATKLIGIDVDTKRINWLKSEGYDVEVVDVQTNRNRLAELCKKVDVVVIPELIEHLDNVGLFLENLFYCEFDNDILISTPNSFSHRHVQFLSQGIEMVHPDHNYYFSPVTLTTLLKKHGFEVKRYFMYYSPGNDEFSNNYEKLLYSSPYVAEGIIVIVRRKSSRERP